MDTRYIHGVHAEEKFFSLKCILIWMIFGEGFEVGSILLYVL